MLTDGIVFLDFDGVLNSTRCHGLPPYRGCTPICPVHAARVAHVCDEGRAGIVLVTSWLADHTPDELASLLREAGITAPVVDALTVAESSDRHRGAAVCAWLARHPDVTRWVVLDDSRSCYPGMDRIVAPLATDGIEGAHVDAALAFLRG